MDTAYFENSIPEKSEDTGKIKIDVMLGGEESTNTSSNGQESTYLNNISHVNTAWITILLFLYRFVTFFFLAYTLTQNGREITRLLRVSKALCICSLLADLVKILMKNTAISDKKNIHNFWIKFVISNTFAIFLGFIIWSIYNNDASKLMWIYPICALGSLLAESLLSTLFDRMFDYYIFPTGLLLFILSLISITDIKNSKLISDLFWQVYFLYLIAYGLMSNVEKTDKFNQRNKQYELILGAILIGLFMGFCWCGIKHCLSVEEVREIVTAPVAAE